MRFSIEDAQAYGTGMKVSSLVGGVPAAAAITPRLSVVSESPSPEGFVTVLDGARAPQVG